MWNVSEIVFQQQNTGRFECCRRRRYNNKPIESVRHCLVEHPETYSGSILNYYGHRYQFQALAFTLSLSLTCFKWKTRELIQTRCHERTEILVIILVVMEVDQQVWFHDFCWNASMTYSCRVQLRLEVLCMYGCFHLCCSYCVSWDKTMTSWS